MNFNGYAPVALEDLERTVYSRNHDKGIRQLIQLLRNFAYGDGLPTNAGSLDAEALASRVCNAITALVMDPACVLSDTGYKLLASGHPQLSGIFRLGSYGTADHVMGLLGIPAVESNRGDKLTTQAFKKALLMDSLHSRRPMNVRAVAGHDPLLASWILFGMLESHDALSPDAETRRTHLLSDSDWVASLDLQDEQIERAVNAWMVCSYADYKYKHRLKRFLNLALRRWLMAKALHDTQIPLQRKLKDRPTVLVPLEHFTSIHAVYRCYAPSIQQLKKRFRVIGMAHSPRIDEESRRCFDDIIEFDNASPSMIGKRVEEVRSLDPDMIFFPTLGMQGWTVALANLRLAPIQIAAPGHPATTQCETIDYMVLGRDHFSDPEVFSERLLVLRSGGFQGILRSDAPALEPVIRESPETVKVAVVSKSFKITWRFLSVCREILERAERAVEFHVFPDERGLMYQQLSKNITEALPGATVYPATSYSQYLGWLNECDIRLGTFPFGGSNSNVDVLRQGIPLVAKQGPEPHEMTDARCLRLMDLPAWVIASSVEEYIEAALRLIDDDEVRVNMARRILEQEPERRLFEREKAMYPDDMADVFHWAYRNHEAIQGTSVKVWDFADSERLERYAEEGRSNFMASIESV